MQNTSGTQLPLENWGSPISATRKSELMDYQESWKVEPGSDPGPFAGVRLSGSDVFWLAVQTLTKLLNDPTKAEDLLRSTSPFFGPFADGLTMQEMRQRSHAVNLSELHLEQADLSQAQLQGANLNQAHLEGASLYFAQLDGAYLWHAHLSGANLYYVSLRRAYLNGADLERANLSGAHMDEAYLWRAQLRSAYLSGTELRNARLQNANLERTDLTGAQLERANLWRARLVGAYLSGANLQEASLQQAHLNSADLRGAQLIYANLSGASLEGANLRGTTLAGADLRQSVLDARTILDDVRFMDETGTSPRVADVRWRDANLTVVNWTSLGILGDEIQARNRLLNNGAKKDNATRLEEFEAAVRANRQLAVALQAQGLTEDADRFAYNARILQQIVLRRRGGRHWGAWLFSIFLDRLAGFGYKPLRSLVLYIVLLLGFSVGYYLLGPSEGTPLSPSAALVLSICSFHGRGFFSTPGASLESHISELAAIEAVLGLLIEISFIATFTQRFFGTR